MEASGRVRRHLRSNVIGYVALFCVVAGGTAYATHPGGANTISTLDIQNGEVRLGDLANASVNGNKLLTDSVTSEKVVDNTLTANDLANNAVRSQEIREPLALGGTFNDVLDPETIPAETLEVANAGSGAAIRVPDAGNYGIHVNNVGTDGLRILETGDDGIQIGSDPDYPSYGVYTPSPGVPFYALWPNTSEANGDWALFTVDAIEAGNVGASSFSILAKATGAKPLRAGDIASPTGVADPFPGATSRLSTVRRAGGSNAAVGVVAGRMVLEPGPGKKDVGMRSAPGPARSGDYVALTTLGVADGTVAAGSGIAAGERLAASAGAARALRTARVDGVEVSEGAPTIGVALGEPDPGTGTVPVFVSPG
jgi:hypothetical protein